jgi:hypothetical protein
MLLWPVLIVVTLETWSFPHYLAPMVGVIYFLLLLSARYLRTWSRTRGIGISLVRAVGLACFFSLFLRLFLLPGANVPSWAGEKPIDWGRPHVFDRLDREPGNHLVLVDYHFVTRQDSYNEWVYNSADLASQKIIWAHRMEPQESDRDLECYFADRQLWLATIGYFGDGFREGFKEHYSLQKLPRPSCPAAPSR